MQVEEEANVNSIIPWVLKMSSPNLQKISIRAGLFVTKHLVS